MTTPTRQNWPQAPLKAGLLAFARIRSGLFSLEALMSPVIEASVTGRRPRLPTDDLVLFQSVRRELDELLKRDIENLWNGQFPVRALQPENPFRHLARIPGLYAEAVRMARRRHSRQTRDFSAHARGLLKELPDYYRRNFHYQGDGYLSQHSSELYEHQVEVLFAGAAGAMRRLILGRLRSHFGRGDGEGLTFLEVGAGNGAATWYVRLAFPKAKIVLLDLSDPYLQAAQRKLRAFPRHDFVQGDAARLPFKDSHFDAVYSVFLFHELPLPVRQQVIDESLRVLKQGGFFGLVDSLQLGDNPGLDAALRQFPREFHEPFYPNYLMHPMEELLRKAGLRNVTGETGFFSKALGGAKIRARRGKKA